MKPIFSAMHTFAIFLLASLATISLAQAQAPSADWVRAQTDVQITLKNESAGPAGLMVKAKLMNPRTAQEALFKIKALLVAGSSKDAVVAVGELKRICPGLEQKQLELICDDCAQIHHAWDVDRAVIENFAGNIFAPQRVWRYLDDQYKETGWSREMIDRWLAGLAGSNPNSPWVLERLRNYSSYNWRGPLYCERLDRILKNPKDVAGAIAFLNIEEWHLFWNINPYYDSDLTTLVEIIKPVQALQARDLAKFFQREGEAERAFQFKYINRAITYYDLATAIPLTQAELDRLGYDYYEPDWKRVGPRFAAEMRENKAQCLKKLGHHDEALKCYLESDAIRRSHDLQRNFGLIGEYQAASPHPVPDEQILEADEKTRQTPRYWLTRAWYFNTRKNPKLEEEACVQALALTKPESRSRFGKIPLSDRCNALGDYSKFLKKMNRAQEGVALLRNEIALTSATSQAAFYAIVGLQSNFADQVRPDDELLWTWLENNPKWDYEAEEILKTMLKNAPEAERQKYFDKALALSKGKDPSRAKVLNELKSQIFKSKI